MAKLKCDHKNQYNEDCSNKPWMMMLCIAGPFTGMMLHLCPYHAGSFIGFLDKSGTSPWACTGILNIDYYNELPDAWKMVTISI